MPKFQVYVSDALLEELRRRAAIAGVPMSALACVLLDQGLSGYANAAPSSGILTAGSGQLLADRVPKSQDDFAAPSSGEREGSPEKVLPARGRAGREAPPAREARSGCPGQPGRGVRCKLCGQVHKSS